MAFLAVSNIVSGTPPIAPPKDVFSAVVANGQTVAAGDALIYVIATGRVQRAAANSPAIHAIALEGGTGNAGGTVRVRIAYNVAGVVYETVVATTVTVREGDSNRRLVVATMGLADTVDVDGPVNVLRIAGGIAFVTLNCPWS